jgi:hypothetical protein
MAVRAIPSMCKDDPSVLPKLADILCQLLQHEDLRELDNVKHNLVSVLRLDTKGKIIHRFVFTVGSYNRTTLLSNTDS